MNKLVLEILDSPTSDPAHNRYIFDNSGGTIGRNPNNDWVLSDPGCIISGTHAQIIFTDGGYAIKDSSSNGTYIHPDNKPACKQQGTPLNDGDILELGDFSITVSLIPSDKTNSPPPNTDKHTDKKRQQDKPLTAEHYFSHTHPIKPASTRWALDLATDQAPYVEAGFHSSINSLPATDKTAPPIKHNHLDNPTTTLTTKKVPTNWDSEENQPSLNIPPEADENQATITTNKPQQKQKASPKIEHEQVASNTHAGISTDDFKQFLLALGLSEEQTTAAKPNTFAEIFQLITDGIIQILQSRNQFRQHFRLAVTSIQKKDNNPLTFSVDADDAIHNLFVKKNAVYMDPQSAYRDALAAIDSHQYAVIAGIRAGFEAMLSAFSPEALKGRLNLEDKPSWIASLRSDQQFFTAYQNLYNSMINDKEHAFIKLFGEAFTHTYEEASYRSPKPIEETAL